MKYFISLFFFLFSSFTYATPEISLRDKIGQMLLIGFDGKHINAQSEIVKIIDENNIGGIILFDFNKQKEAFGKNIESPNQVKQLNQDLQSFNKQSYLKHNRPPLPLLISVDYEGGTVNRLASRYGFPVIPSAADVGAKNAKEAESVANTMAEILKNAGFNLNFSPDLDVNINPENPIIGKRGRSFSQDPIKVAHYGEIYAQTFLNQNIQCAYKHFPGHGSSINDSHLGFVDVTKTWKSSELIPYRLALSSPQHCGAVMTAHIINRNLDPSGLPASLSYKVLTELLRKKLHFNGVIITDDFQMKAISKNYKLEPAVVLAINAGADILLFGNNTSEPPQDPKAVIDIIEANVLSGKISPKRIDEAYQRIVTFKHSLRSN